MVDDSKPPYRIPSMAEVRDLEPNGYRVVSTFTGCGGSCLGFRMAGFTTVWASEFVDAARDTYLANFPDVPVDPRDIRDVTAADILDRTGLAAGELDVLEGSPPCSAFSTAGKREAGWGRANRYSEDKVQVVDDLFFEYARLLRGLQPRVFVAENVSGLVKGKAKGYFKAILAELRGCGYRVKASLLDAQWLGVPQARQRLIFVGVRDDLGLDPVFPKPLPYRYSVRDALPWITGDAPDGFDKVDEKAWLRPAYGGEWDKLKPGGQSPKFFNLMRVDPDEPSPTVVAAGGGGAGVTHPYERRKFTIPELRRICGFPDDFTLTGSYNQQWERLGRAVPPPMMRAVAETVRDRILRVADEKQ